TEIIEWNLFAAFLSFDGSAKRGGMQPQHALWHLEWILQRPFHSVAEFLGPVGDKFRKRWGMRAGADAFKATWAAFRAERRSETRAEAERDLEQLQREFERALANGRLIDLDDRRSKRKFGVGGMNRRPRKATPGGEAD